jgi:HAD superfamily hydrolase (TIGR01549 family)
MDRKKLTHVLFDFDGTLVDSRKNIANSLNDALAKGNLSQIDPQKIYPLIGKKNLQDTFLFFYPDLNEAVLTQLISDFRTYQLSHAVDELEVFPDVSMTLKTLHDQGVSSAIFTTKHYAQVTKILEMLNLKQYFSIIYGTGLPHGEKPDPSCVAYILSQLPVSQDGAVAMVGDSEVDAQAAKLANIRFIGVAHGVDSVATLMASGAEVVLDSFSELRGYCEG